MLRSRTTKRKCRQPKLSVGVVKKKVNQSYAAITITGNIYRLSMMTHKKNAIFSPKLLNTGMYKRTSVIIHTTVTADSQPKIQQDNLPSVSSELLSAKRIDK